MRASELWFGLSLFLTKAVAVAVVLVVLVVVAALGSLLIAGFK